MNDRLFTHEIGLALTEGNVASIGKLRRLFADYAGAKLEDVTPRSRIGSDLRLDWNDSINLIDFVVDLEGFDIPDAELPELAQLNRDDVVLAEVVKFLLPRMEQLSE